MNEQENNWQSYNRRDFLRGGSMASLMAMMGGVRLFAQANATPAAESKLAGPKLKVAVVGLGAWGREIISALALIPQAELAAICDYYPAFLRRAATNAPGAAQVEDFKAVLDNKDIKAVIIATPTHKHKDLVLAALQAGKHVYCEAPIAHTLEDAKAIASAAKAARHLVFQAGLQRRCDPPRTLLIKTFRSGALGTQVMARSQWHKKTNWRANSPNPQREKEMNWRLSKATSPGLIGEIGIHQLDSAAWFFNKLPVAVSGFGAIAFYKDERDVPDTIQTVFEFADGVKLTYDATLANSFDSEYELYFGSDSAVMLRESDVWLFKEVDAPLLGWEVYYPKETFYKETGIVLKAGASKSTPAAGQPSSQPTPVNTPLSTALTTFVRNAADFVAAREDFINSIGDDPEALVEHLATKVQKRPAAGYLEGYQSAVMALKANEAILSGQRVVIPKELYDLA